MTIECGEGACAAEACDVHGGGDVVSVEVPRTVLQAVFDLAVGSMDFASGFFEDEDTEATRAIAVLLGIDPMLGTPRNHRCKHLGTHGWSRAHTPGGDRWCSLCGLRVPFDSELLKDVKT